ncbi:putative F-box domain, FBD domain, leucine-rich repeat domain, L domain-containing protein [Rosa chinensis]|uniref:Putative F-box domain, FBD domain, leucine-rich repeat domain, L domain-containing protein n=1 Tax=Rosa chinensis TaxID=74649 RepID=A0A2P6PB71_ROSCH|nr:putative F-box domain, FBD domain, leucine-rich repeat domain, L domain-containing protein [Rosa chinensis]
MGLISHLPDNVLVTIVSFLAFREAARTLVLARRWQNIWRQTRNIEFNELFFSYIGKDEDDARRIAFVNFLQNWINNYQPTVLDRVCVTFSRPGNFPVLVEECIRFAITSEVKALGLDFSDPSWGDDVLLGNSPERSFVLPQVVYQHGVLESLTLLFLQVQCGRDNFSSLEASFTCCQLLERLSLKNCWNTTGLQIGGKNLRLRSLVVDKFIMSENPWIEIEASNLKYFKYSGTMAVFDIRAGELEEVYLEFGLESEGDEAMGDRHYQLLHQLPVRMLTVCQYMLQALVIQIVPQRSVELAEGEPDDVDDVWTPNSPDYHCVSQTLKVVQLRGYKETRHEVSFLKYLFFHGHVLGQLHILIAEELRNQRSVAENRRLVMKTFQGLRRASDNLSINLYGR